MVYGKLSMWIGRIKSSSHLLKEIYKKKKGRMAEDQNLNVPGWTMKEFEG